MERIRLIYSHSANRRGVSRSHPPVGTVSRQRRPKPGTERKVTKESPVNVAFHTRKLSRIVLDTLKHQVEFIEKPST